MQTYTFLKISNLLNILAYPGYAIFTTQVKLEMHDSDDEPLNKIIKLGDDVIDDVISCKEEPLS